MTQRLYVSAPADPIGVLSPIRRLAPNWPVLGLIAIALLAVSILAGILEYNVWQLVVGVASATLGLLSIATALTQSHRKYSGAAVVSNPLAQAFDSDLDPILITDYEAKLIYANKAAQGFENISESILAWCVDPEETIAHVLDELRQHASSERSFHRSSETLHVFALCAGDQIVWRLRRERTSVQRTFDDFALPIVALDGGGEIIPNHAASSALDPSVLADLSALKTNAHFDAEAFQQRFSNDIYLSDGSRCLPIRLPPHEGRRDILLLPRDLLPSTEEGTQVFSAQSYDFEDIPVALVELDAEGNVVGSNRLARALLGLVSGEQQPFWEIVEGLGRPVSDWLEDARAGRALGRPEVLRASAASQETFVQIILRRAAGARGSSNLMAVVSDATELKSLEARFVQSQKMQAIGQLAGGVAHDFNNLLTAISGHCDLLLLNRDRFDPDYNDLLQIHQNSNRAAALVRQLLAFSRKQTLKPETFRLESLLEDLTHLLTRLVGERIVLSLTHDPNLSAVRADRRQLEQVVMNLVVNARDAMPMGGTIKIETQARMLAQETEIDRVKLAAGEYAVIRVKDSGVGIPAGNLEKIFEPFFTTKRLGEGTGLGLSTAYGIVKQMGGYIFVESEEGTGTTFSLFFAGQSHAHSEEIQSDGELPAVEVRPATQSGDVAKQAVLQQRTTEAARRAPVDASKERTIEPEPVTNQSHDEGRGTHQSAQDLAQIPKAKEVAPLSVEPASAAGHEVGIARISPPETAVKTGTILLVEDEAPVRAFAARALRMQGYQVFEAQDGEQALEFLSESSVPIDLFVSDVVMPGIDGPGWITQALATHPDTPVVFVSGYTEDALSASLVRIPRAAFLGKPFSLQDLSETIATQIEA